jgi:two-component system cell cycle sensor histidine kinase/response regulator CckA
VELQLSRLQGAKNKGQKSFMQVALSDPARRRILVVEDDKEIRSTLCGLLEEEGYDVHPSGNGSDALDWLRRGPTPELIILDLMMPGMDGWEFRTIQRADPQLASIPVVAISADTSAKASAIDATRFLCKPFRLTDLLEVVEKIINEQEQRRTRARLAEAERLASLGTLAAGAAHEIANPLSFTVANLATIEEQLARMRQLIGQLPGAGVVADNTIEELRATLDDVRELLADGRVGAERVSRVVRNLQSIARRQDEPHRSVDLGKVIESAVALAWNQIRHRARLLKEIGTLVPVHGSEYRLGQLFVNLLLNAAQAIPEGSAQTNQIRVAARRDERGMIVEVQDTGEGMPPDTKARLFEPFFTTKPGGVGTGLGLSICQSVLVEHGGAIEVESEPGRGSLFRVILPFADPMATSPAAVSSAQLVSAGRRGHVLIVDDEPQLAWAIKRLLDPEHEVVAVTHGREALDRMAAGQRFDVIVCDLTMPYMNGEELYKEVERRFGPTMAAHILFVTGGTLSDDTRIFLEQVPNPRLYKPFEAEELRASVRKLVALSPSS